MEAGETETPTSRALVQRLMLVLDAHTDDDLVRKLHERGVVVQLRSLTRWKRGTNGPNWSQAVPLLRIAGWLDQEAAQPDVHVLLRSLEARMAEAELAQNVAATEVERLGKQATARSRQIAALTRRVTALEKRVDPGSAPAAETDR